MVRFKLQDCSCTKGFPVISEVSVRNEASFYAMHSCSYCEKDMFRVELKPGMQIIATKDIVNVEGSHTVPRGRLLRISAFGESPSSLVGLIFAGLFASGAFNPAGFSANWDINKILVEEN